MKKFLCTVLALALVVLSSSCLWADVAINASNFPDDAFRETVNKFDKDKNGVLTNAEIGLVKNLSVSKVYSLKGIEYFTALTSLSCQNNYLTELDVSRNTALTALYCYGNHLTQLDVSNNPNLTTLGCSNNQITSLNLRNNTKLSTLACTDNYITELDLSNNTLLLTVNCYRNKLTTLNVRNLVSMTKLYCYDNQITSLNVNDCISLTDLRCYNNAITVLNVSNNTALTYLACDKNQLSKLDVSGNKKLKNLYCGTNYIAFLDLGEIYYSHLSINYQTIDGLKITSTGDALYPYQIDFRDYMPSDKTANILSSSVEGRRLNNSKFEAVYSNGIAKFAELPNSVFYKYITESSRSSSSSYLLNVTISKAKNDPDPVPDNINITKSSLANGTVGTSYNDTLTSDTSGVTWSVSSGNLPSGLTLSSSTGTISGTPTTAGSYSFTITASANGASTNKNFTIEISNIPMIDINITKSSLVSGIVGSSYNDMLTADTSGVTWSVSSGSLPDGLTLNASTGTITGIPTTQGTYNFTITASNGTSSSSKNFTITINPQVITLEITSANSISGKAGQSLTFNLTANISGVTWTASGLPAGLTLDASTGAITGLPTNSGTFTATVTASANGQTANQTLSIIIEAETLTITTSSLPAGKKGQSYTYTLTTNIAGATWEIAGLPSGLRVDALRGTISGTPTTSGSFTLAIRARAFGQIADKTLTLVISSDNTSVTPDDPIIDPIPETTITILNSSLPNASAGNSYSVELFSDASNVTWSVSNGTLPAGLTLNASTGRISGTPTTAGNYTFTLNASNSSGSGEKSFTITVNANSSSTENNFAITTMFLSDGTVGTPYSQQLTATTTSGLVWRVSNGALPGGLSLSQTGFLSGTPTTAGTTTIEITAANGNERTSSYFTLTINPYGSLTITSSSEIRAKVNEEVTFTFTANISGVKWYADASLPAGLSLNPDSGALRGTPTSKGTYPFTVTSIGNGQSASRYITFIVEDSGNNGGNNGGESGGGGGCNSLEGLYGLLTLAGIFLLRKK